ncbi:MAG: F0F1 ATP synthase subunit delta [Nitrospirota bacterium]
MKFNIWTFLFQIVNFIVLFFILKRLLYKPVKEIMEKRKGLIEKTIEDAEKEKKEALELKERHQEEMNKLKGLQITMIEKMKNEVGEEKKRLLTEAEKEAARTIEEERAVFETEKKRDEAKLKEMVIQTVSVFATNLLKDISDEELHKSIYRRVFNNLEDIASTIQAGDGESATIDLISAFPLREEELIELQKVLESRLIKKVSVNTSVDKNLIAGVKIKVHDMVYDSSLSGQINSLTFRLKEKA